MSWVDVRAPRRRVILGVFAAASLALGGCAQNMSGFLGDPNPAPPKPAPATPTSGDIIGTGSTRVALILPRTAGGVSGQVAQELKNAAELGFRDFPGADIQIIVKDDQGSTEGGQAAAQQAVGEGAKLIIGPLFGLSVRGAAAPARAAGIPIVSFSTDPSVAARGVYLFGYMPTQDAERIVAFAASQGKKNFAALLPNDAYGAVVEGAFRQAVTASGGRVVAVEKHSGTDVGEKAQAIGRLGAQVDAVFVPDGPARAAAIVQALRASGADAGRVTILGSGQWDDAATYSLPPLVGAWFPGPDQGGISAFRQRFKASFGRDPSRIAVLGYEAVVLAAGLVRQGANPFRDEMMLRRDGFLGVTGIFRFNPDGTNQRGLAVYEVNSGSARVLSPAPRAFAAGS